MSFLLTIPKHHFGNTQYLLFDTTYVILILTLTQTKDVIKPSTCGRITLRQGRNAH